MVTKRVGQSERKGERGRQRQRATYAQLSRIFAACKANEITAGKRIVRGVESREREGVRSEGRGVGYFWGGVDWLCSLLPCNNIILRRIMS